MSALTSRQRFCLTHATRSNRWIAQNAGWSQGTIENEFTTIRRILGIRGGGGTHCAVLMAALRQGVITLNEIDAACDERRWPPQWNIGWII